VLPKPGPLPFLSPDFSAFFFFPVRRSASGFCGQVPFEASIDIGWPVEFPVFLVCPFFFFFFPPSSLHAKLNSRIESFPCQLLSLLPQRGGLDAVWFGILSLLVAFSVFFSSYFSLLSFSCSGRFRSRLLVPPPGQAGYRVTASPMYDKLYSSLLVFFLSLCFTFFPPGSPPP